MAIAPSRPRAAMTDSSRTKSAGPPGSTGTPPMACEGRGGVGGDARSRPGPCRHSRRGGSSAGRARRCRSAARRSGRPALSTAAKATVAAPTALRKVFSSTRSWATARAVGPGRDQRPQALGQRSTEAAGTFSNSKVTTSARPAQRRQGRRDRHRRRRSGLRGHPAGRAVRPRGSRIDDVEAEARGGLGQHAAQLAAAEDAEGRAGRKRKLGHGSLSPRPSRRRLRSGSRRRRSGVRPGRRRTGPGSARPAGRRSWPPASPMARVPTGMPPGIWTMDSRLSMPFSALDSTGTPSTGRSVMRGGHAGQVGGAAGPGDDDLEAGRLGARGEVVQAFAACGGRETTLAS